MAKVSYEDLISDLQWYSDAVSKSVRTIAFGVIAALWAIFTAQGISLEDHGLWGMSTYGAVRAAFVLASLTLVTDVLQYISGLWMTNIGIDRWDRAETEGQKIEFFYNRQNLGIFGMGFYWLNFALFPIKLLLALSSAFAFVVIAFGIQVNSN